MHFLILEGHYPEPLRLVYRSNPGMERRPYQEQLQAVYDLGFGRSDHLVRHLQELGHAAEQVIINSITLQRRWAVEHNLQVPLSLSHPLMAQLQYMPQRVYRSVRRRLGLPLVVHPDHWNTEVVAAQVETLNPDIIFNTSIAGFPPEFLWKIKGQKRKLIGECGYPVPANLDLRAYDLVVSCCEHFVDRFRAMGLRAELWRHGFDPSVLERLGSVTEQQGVSFVGSLTSAHRQRIDVLEAVSRRVPLDCWGSGEKYLPRSSPLRGRVHPAVWGYAMYRQLQRSKMTLNFHIDVAENYAGNVRLFEATGVGTLLITDWKVNLHKIFEPGQEVIAYRSPEDCAEQVQYYLEHDDERRATARAGQQRTLRDHTYYRRAQELLGIVCKYF